MPLDKSKLAEQALFSDHTYGRGGVKVDELLEPRGILFVKRKSDYLAALPAREKLAIEVQAEVESTSPEGLKIHLCVEIDPQCRYIFSQQR